MRSQGTGGKHLIHPDDLARVDAETRRVAGSDGAVTGFEYRIKHKDGRWRWLSWSGDALTIRSACMGSACRWARQWGSIPGI